MRDGVEVGPVRLHPRPEDLRPRDGRRGALLEDRADAPRQPRLDRLPALRLLGHARAVPLLRDRDEPAERPHGAGEDAGAARRGGRGGRAPRRRQGRDAHHRHPQPRRPRRPLHGPLRRGDPRRQRPARAGADRAAVRLRLVRRAQGERRRGPRAAPRGVGRGRARARRPRQARPGPRPLPRRLGGGRRRLRPRPGLHLLHPRARREPRVGDGGLPRRHRPGRLPVRGAAAAGAGQHRGRRRAALGRVRARGLRAGRAAAGRGRDDEPGRPRRLRALPGLLGAQHLRARLRRRPRRRAGAGRPP